MLPVLEVPGQLQRGAAVVVSFLSDDCPSLNVACVGSVRSTSGGFAAVVVLEVSGQLHVGVHLLSGVLLNGWTRPVNFRGVCSWCQVSF